MGIGADLPIRREHDEGGFGMNDIEVKCIHKENERREMHEILDLRNADFPYFTDRIVISLEGGNAFTLSQFDFRKIYEMKEKGIL